MEGTSPVSNSISPAGSARRARYRAPAHLRSSLYNGAILYTTCNEDSMSELTALQVGPPDEVLAVTGSGFRALHMLIGRPQRVVAIDANPLQGILLDLKIVAIRRLEHHEFVAFVGLQASGERWRTYQALRGELTAEARAFWDLNRAVIDDGLLFSGAHESYYRRFVGPALVALRRRKLGQLFAFDDVAEQHAFYRDEWDNWLWRNTIRALFRPLVFRLLLKDPSYYRQVGRPESSGQYMLSRIESFMENRLARESDFLALVCLGSYLADAVPPCLSASHYDVIREGLDSVEIVTESLPVYLGRQPPATFTKFSLSDVSGWLDSDAFELMLREVARTSRPLGRLCYRNLLIDRRIPAALESKLRRLSEVEEELERRDLACAYTFCVAEVAG